MSSNRLVAAVDTIDSFLRRLARSYLLVVIVALIVGLLLAPVAFFGAASDPAQVAVVPVAGTIDGPNEQQISTQLTQAREDPDVEAVVLLINSGGGSAAASEELYLEISRTADAMPVVAAVDAGALSGAYFAAAPSDEIYAKPASSVGSVGVIVTAPQDIEPQDLLITTGPSKTVPDDQREFQYGIEEVNNAFANAVFEHRDDELQLTRAELTESGTYTGTTADELGLVDRIGGREQATAKAAQLAGLEEYSVTVLQPDGPIQFIAQANYVAADTPEKELVSPSYLTGQGTDASGAINYLAIPAAYAIPENKTVVTESDVSELEPSAEGETEVNTDE